MGKPGGDRGRRRAPLSREQVSYSTKSVSSSFTFSSRGFSNPRCLGHLEDTLQSLVGEGNAQGLPYSPPRQSYTALFDGDTWDAFCTDFPSQTPADTNQNAHNYDQQSDSNILPAVGPSVHQESPFNSHISNESQSVHTTELAVSTANEEQKNTLYEFIYTSHFTGMLIKRQVATLFRAYSARLSDVPKSFILRRALCQ